MIRTLTDVRRDVDGRLFLTVTEESENRPRPLRHRFPVSDDDYEEAGAPKKGDTLFPEDYTVLRRESEKTEAIEKAYSILAMADNSVFSLRQKLRMRGFSKDSIDSAVSYMEEHGYLSEGDQIRRLIVRTLDEKAIGRRKLCEILARKGYVGAAVSDAIEDMIHDGTVDFDALKQKCLLSLPKTATPEEKRAFLYKNGF